jgi:hypothetical protein
MTTSETTTYPVHDIANVVGVGIGIAATVVTAALGSGLVPKTFAAKGGALVGLLKVLPPVVAGVFALLAAKTVAVQATPLVTPVSTVTNILNAPGDVLGSLSKLVGKVLS